MQAFAEQQSLFRAYDIRGDKRYFTDDFIQALGDAFFRLYASNACHKVSSTSINEPASKNPTVIVGFDVRCGSSSIAQALATRLQQQGLQVIYLGLITTPMMAFWTEQYDGHGIMVTASHSPKDILGVKWLRSNHSPSEIEINALYQDLSHSTTMPENIPSPPTTPAIISLPTDAVAAPYIEAVKHVFAHIYGHKHTSVAKHSVVQHLDMTVVIDCMHGATSRIALPLFTQFCQRVIIINDTPDGNFPMGNPDPTEPNRLAELQQTVIVNQADIGLAFDGDGDRLMIVDDSGKVVMSDHLLYLLARVAITERPMDEYPLVNQRLTQDPSTQDHSTQDCSINNKSNNDNTDVATLTPIRLTPHVLFDVKCSHHLPLLIKDLGATPIISRTGSSFMREQLKSSDCHIIFAGELSGHFIFNDGYFTAYDDAMYAGLRLLHWLAHTSDHNHLLSPALDSWGDPVSTATLYRLTNITRQLPNIVITADHYLPMSAQSLRSTESSSGCSIIKRLAQHCHYLQHLTFNNSHQDGTQIDHHLSCAAAGCKQECCLPYATTAQAQQLLPEGTQMTCIDGVRLDFAHGFGVLRQSNTSHSLTVRFAADSIEDLQDIQARFVTLCEGIDEELAEQLAAIGPE